MSEMVVSGARRGRGLDPSDGGSQKEIPLLLGLGNGDEHT